MTNVFLEDESIQLRKGILVSALLVSTVLFTIKSHAQTRILKDSPFVKGTTVAVPGPEFQRSGYHNLFWGKHYRREWTTAVRGRNFYIDTAMGGLTPVSETGRRQSAGFRLKDKDGK